MSFLALSSVRHKVRIREPLPFGVLDANGQLLLSRGYTIQNEDQLTTLCDRGSLVMIDDADLATAQAQAQDTSPARASDRIVAWSACTGRLSSVIADSKHENFKDALDEASAPVLDLISRDPDFAILQAMRAKSSSKLQYALRHSLHTALVSRLVAERLGWDVSAMISTFKAALTMNLSVMELQSELAATRLAPSADDRRMIFEHPARSRELLEAAGITDQDWLRAVEHHHERPDGSGYPLGACDVDEKARLIQLADIYCARLSPRAGRLAILPDRVGRDLFVSDSSNHMTHALMREFGIYPPGTYVRLASGEKGVVVKRGPTMLTPIVAALTWRSGEPLGRPARRDTAQPSYKILKALPASEVGVPVTLEALAQVH